MSSVEDEEFLKDNAHLDPCCLRELIDRRKAAQLKAKLAKYDLTNKRNNLIQGVLKNVKRYASCECCASYRDYDELSKLRKCLDMDVKKDEEALNEMSDNSDDELFNDFVSERELEMRKELLLKETNRNNALTQGFGEHKFESLDHLLNFIDSKAMVVLHIGSSSEYSALIDLALESLAKKYVGTLFRRLFWSPMVNEHVMSRYSIRCSESTSSTLLCFAGGVCVHSCSDIMTRLGLTGICVDNGAVSVLERELHKYLSVCSSDAELLLDSLPLVPVEVTNTVEDSSEEEDIRTYCDVVGCNKLYPHIHSGGADDNLFGFVDKQGMDALAKDFYYKL